MLLVKLKIQIFSLVPSSLLVDWVILVILLEIVTYDFEHGVSLHIGLFHKLNISFYPFFLRIYELFGVILFLSNEFFIWEIYFEDSFRVDFLVMMLQMIDTSKYFDTATNTAHHTFIKLLVLESHLTVVNLWELFKVFQVFFLDF